MTDKKTKNTNATTKNSYYHQRRIARYTFMIPAGMRVLHLNCGNGDLLAALKPSIGVGLDVDADYIAKASAQHPGYQFLVGSLETIVLEAQEFDYIILDTASMQCVDIEKLLTIVRSYCHAHTRVIVDVYSRMWRMFISIAQRFGWMRKEALLHWLSLEKYNQIYYLTGFDSVTQSRSVFIPFYIPLVSWVANTFLTHLPLANRLCMHGWMVVRPGPEDGPTDVSVSVIVPCKNEKGNIEPTIKNMPTLGASMEIVFVEGHSTDGTLEEMKRVMAAYPDKKIRCYVQDGTGKADAVRKGCAEAMGDMLIIHDGDYTVSPQELTKFFNALVNNKGELINGSRTVYRMEQGAMKTLNWGANMAFSIVFTWLLDQAVGDTLCGTKALWKKYYERIEAGRSFFGNYDPFGDFDLLFGAAKMQLRIVDVPVHYKKRTYGTSQIKRWADGMTLLRMSIVGVFKFKFK